MSSGYIVYVDETGDHSLTKIKPDYPMFVLAFCIFPIDIYVDRVVPLVQQIKFDFCNHDMVVLLEREIRPGGGSNADRALPVHLASANRSLCSLSRG
jgi:hypothetical protein